MCGQHELSVFVERGVHRGEVPASCSECLVVSEGSILSWPSSELHSLRLLFNLFIGLYFWQFWRFLLFLLFLVSTVYVFLVTVIIVDVLVVAFFPFIIF